MGEGGRVALALILTVALSGCYTLRVDVADSPVGETVTERHNFYIGGGIPTTLLVDVTEKCPNGVASLRESITFVDTLLHVVTLTIYSPRTTTYHCIGEAAR